MAEITEILQNISIGQKSAATDLLPLVYSELRQLAGRKLVKEKPGQILQPTALVHEAYLRLVGNNNVQWDGRSHFFAAAAESMRRILIDYARKRKSIKHGGDVGERELTEADAIVNLQDVDGLLDLDSALTKLASDQPELARLVELRYFAGLSVEDTAQVLGVSSRTVKRNWSFARAWLGRELNGGESAIE